VHEVARPGLAARARVLEPPRFRSREADHQHVRPAVAVEVAREVEEGVRVALGVEHLRRVELEALAELRPAIHEGPRDHVGVPVAVEVGEGGALAVELRRELVALEGDRARRGACAGSRGVRVDAGLGSAAGGEAETQRGEPVARRREGGLHRGRAS
jgi:hypothetical protein